MNKKSQLIRLDPKVFNELDEFRFEHETFSGAVSRLLQLHKQEREMLKSLGGGK